MAGEVGSITSDYDNNNNIVCVPVSLVYSRASRPGLHRWIYHICILIGYTLHIKFRSSYRRNRKKRNVRRAKSAAEFDATTIQQATVAAKKRHLFRLARSRFVEIKSRSFLNYN